MTRPICDTLPPRSCDTCRYGDNGSNPEGCSASCFEPELTDWDPDDKHTQYLWPVAKPVGETEGGK